MINMRSLLLQLPAAALCLTSLLAGCASTGGTSELTATSLESGSTLVPTFATMVYRTSDDSSADLYLTDLPLARLADPGDDLRDLQGQIMHVHMFMVPKPGKTPVDDTACNAAVRHAILSQGAIGVYGGGGFFQPGSVPGSPVFSGGLRGASMRLIRATPNFADRLGNTAMSGRIAADLDETVSRVIAARMDQLARALPMPVRADAATR